MKILIVSYRAPEKLSQCLKSISEIAPSYGVMIWDNFSDKSDQIKLLAQEFPGISWTFHPENIGFAAAVNQLAENVSEDFLLLNPDAILISPLEPLIEKLKSNDLIAAASGGNPNLKQSWDVAHRTPTLLRSIISHAGYSEVLRNLPVSELYRSFPNEIGYLVGACLLIRKNAWDEVGGFDERFFLYAEEADWAIRARKAGYKLYLSNQLLFEHTSHGTVSDSKGENARSASLLRNSQAIFLEKHFGVQKSNIFRYSLKILDVIQRSKRNKNAKP